MELGLGSIRLGLGYDEMAMMVISGGGKCPGGGMSNTLNQSTDLYS